MPGCLPLLPAAAQQPLSVASFRPCAAFTARSDPYRQLAAQLHELAGEQAQQQQRLQLLRQPPVAASQRLSIAARPADPAPPLPPPPPPPAGDEALLSAGVHPAPLRPVTPPTGQLASSSSAAAGAAPAHHRSTSSSNPGAMDFQFHFVQEPQLSELAHYMAQRREHLHLRLSTQVGDPCSL